MRRAGLRRRLKLLGFLDHVDDLVVAAASERLFHTDFQFAFFQDSSRIDVGAGFLAHRKRLAGHGSLVYSAFPGSHHTVERNDVASADNNMVVRHYFADGHEHLAGVLCFDPCAVNIDVHAAGEVVNGLFVCPLFQKGAGVQQEHDGSGGRPVPAQDGYGNCCRVQDGYLEFPSLQALESAAQIVRRLCQADQIPEHGRQDEHTGGPAGHKEEELVLKIPVQFPAGMVGHIHWGIRDVKGRQCRHHGVSGARRV